MRRREAIVQLSTVLAAGYGPGKELLGSPSESQETAAGWSKYAGNPVIGGKYGTVFDVALLEEPSKYRLWGSWRPKKNLALFESKDGIAWDEPVIVLGPNPKSDWEENINRPVVLRRDGIYHLWYTGQARQHSWIGYATSPDGRNFERRSLAPVLSPEQPWEKTSVMCPHVIWDAQLGLFRMWYSGGDQYEPDAIGYATSPDGLRWKRNTLNPIFFPDSGREWEHHKVTACQVVQQDGLHYMFYIGFRDVDHAQIGLARSRDGVSGWERHRANPIIRPGREKWDHDACYKPFAILSRNKWMLWYNGRHNSLEQIGLVYHDGASLGFE